MTDRGVTDRRASYPPAANGPPASWTATSRPATSGPTVSATATSETAAPTPVPDGLPLEASPARFLNRELSWLDFADRLLDLAADEHEPLLERARFLAICSEGLDELFQVRVAGLEDQVVAGVRTRSPDGLRPAEQLAAITGRVAALVERQSRIYAGAVAPALAAAGVAVTDVAGLGPADRAHLEDVFVRRIFPTLTPLAVGQGHPFPYISDLSLNLVVQVEDPVRGVRRVARVKVPPNLPRFVALPDGHRFVPVEQVVAAHLDALFPSMVIAEHHLFRVTRNADLSVDEGDTQDLLAAVELELHRRRFGQAVRLEASAGIPADLLAMLVGEVDVPPDNVVVLDVPLDLGGLRALCELDRPDLAAAPWTPLPPPQLAGGRDLFAVLAEGDVLVHHPYESFAASVEAFVAAAAADPAVLAIKQTLYRTGADSPIADSLIHAARSGKEVTAVVELQARFDEQANIAWARALEEAGAQVTYGLVRLKTHSKASLVLRREGGDIARYCHVGSGNYNSVTARSYEDVGLLTADPDLGADVGELFTLLQGSGAPVAFRRLLVSPLTTRRALLDAVAAETAAGTSGRIVAKTNGLTDPEIIDALYAASRAGVPVDLVVRGRCCLRPGVPGLSETIRVRSIVGHFLEHSRLYRFGGVAGRPLWLLFGSADLMERNLDRRVEVLVPVADPTIRDRLVAVLDAALRDDVNAWSLGPDGAWRRLAPSGPDGFSLQAHLRRQTRDGLRRLRDEAPPAVPTRPVPTGEGRRPPPERTPPPPGTRTPPLPSPGSWWRRRRPRADGSRAGG